MSQQPKGVVVGEPEFFAGDPDAAFRETLAAMNAPLNKRVAALARKLYGRSDSRSSRCSLR